MFFWNKKKKEEDKLGDAAKGEHDEKFVHHEGGSGIFTTSGKELPKIDGGYDIVDPDSGMGDNDYTS